MAGGHAPSFDARLYRAALHLCPGEFRREHGDEMASDFEEARGEAAAAGVRAVATLRLLMGVDLARTIAVQWLRTGLPAIGCVALFCSLALVAGFATVARHIAIRIPDDTVDAEMVGVVLLAAVAVVVIVATIVFNLWVHRPRRAARR
jgi:hypothetical protein